MTSNKIYNFNDLFSNDKKWSADIMNWYHFSGNPNVILFNTNIDNKITQYQVYFTQQKSPTKLRTFILNFKNTV
jgi:hypothetical protein